MNYKDNYGSGYWGHAVKMKVTKSSGSISNPNTSGDWAPDKY
ncbi:MAG: hypothetical protein ACRDD2_06695 [Sarcina sp.]